MARPDAEPFFQRIPVRAVGVAITSAVVAAGERTGLIEKAIENPDAVLRGTLELELGAFAVGLVAMMLYVTRTGPFNR